LGAGGVEGAGFVAGSAGKAVEVVGGAVELEVVGIFTVGAGVVGSAVVVLLLGIAVEAEDEAALVVEEDAETATGATVEEEAGVEAGAGEGGKEDGGGGGGGGLAAAAVVRTGAIGSAVVLRVVLTGRGVVLPPAAGFLTVAVFGRHSPVPSQVPGFAAVAPLAGIEHTVPAAAGSSKIQSFTAQRPGLHSSTKGLQASHGWQDGLTPSHSPGRPKELVHAFPFTISKLCLAEWMQ
jgi:hypothetical protein